MDQSGKSRNTVIIAGSGMEDAVPQWIMALCERFARDGYRTIRIIDRQRTELVDPEANPATLTWPNRRPTGLKDARFLYRVMRTERPCLVIANFGAVNMMTLMGFLCGVPHRVAWFRTTPSQGSMDTPKQFAARIRSWLRIKRKTLVYRFATRIVMNSEDCREQFHNLYPVSHDKTLVFHNSIAGGEPVSGPGNRRMACIGRLSKSKGHRVLLEALALLRARSRDIPCDIFGSGTEMQALQELSEKRNLTDIVTFHGAIPYGEVFEQFGKASLAVVPSLDEAFGFVVVEAMSVGRPVVASRVGGIPEIIREDVDGLLVQPGDPEALASALERVFFNEERRAQMGKHSRQRFLDEFELGGAVDKQFTYFHGLIQSGSGVK